MVEDRIVDLLLIGSGEGNSSNKNDETGGSSSKGNTSSRESLDKALVEERLSDVMESSDLSCYIL